MPSSWNIFFDPSVGDGKTLRSDVFSGGHPMGNVFGNCSAILGGIPAAAPTNTNCADLSVIVMGDNNYIDPIPGGPPYGSFNSIFNGCCNHVLGDYTTIIGGFYHRVYGSASFIGAGVNHQILSISGIGPIQCASIVGGWKNQIGDNGTNTADLAFIGGGYANSIFGVGSSVVGGQANCVYSMFSSIGGGDTNFIGLGSDCSFLGGGNQNDIGAVAGGGLGSTYSVIGGGFVNCIDDTSFASSYSGIVGGTDHYLAGNNLFVGGGDTNNIWSINGFGPVNCSSITGGYNNTISDDTVSATADLSFIGGGCNNNIFSVGSSIVGGQNHNVCSMFSFVGGGDTNCIGAGSAYSVIGGGQENNIIIPHSMSPATWSFIGGGMQNTILDKEAAIAGGTGNCIGAGGCQSFIGAGVCNYIFGGGSAIVTGLCNIINRFSSSNFISGGACNTIGSSSCGITFSAIGGGCCNVIDDTGFPTSFGVIGGGFQNYIAPGTNHSSIFSGNGNCVSGSCSAILGGSGNCDNGFNYVGIFGQNITGVMSNAFHMENAVLQNIPDGSIYYPSLPPGALYYLAVGSGVGSKTVYVV